MPGPAGRICEVEQDGLLPAPACGSGLAAGGVAFNLPGGVIQGSLLRRSCRLVLVGKDIP